MRLETVQGFFVLTKSPPSYVHHPRKKKKMRVAKKNTKQEAYICIKQGKLQRERGTTVICPTKNLQYVHTAQNRGKKKAYGAIDKERKQ